jgi:hypothetical protein
MATTEVIDSLTQVVQDCLEAKMLAGFDANAALTLDIAREVAAAVQTKANEYTDVEIANVLALISGGEVDLGPFTEFMNSVKTLIDGDENTEGYQIFELLISDTAANKQTLINQTTTLAAIQQNLTTMQATLADHEDRIAALEAAQHEPLDCEDCHDELLNIVKNAIGDACTDSTAANSAHYSTEHTSVLASWKNELDPITLTGSLVEVDGSDPARLLADATGRRVYSVQVAYPGGSVVDLLAEGASWGIDAPTALTNGDYTFTVKDESGNMLTSAVVNRTVVEGPLVYPTWFGGDGWNTSYNSNDDIGVAVFRSTEITDPRIHEIRLLDGYMTAAQLAATYPTDPVFLQEAPANTYQFNNHDPVTQGPVYVSSYAEGNGMETVNLNMIAFDVNGNAIGQQYNAVQLIVDGPDMGDVGFAG